MNWTEFLKQHKLTEGQLVKIVNGTEEFVGNIIPSSDFDNGILRLKLDSGYNIGIKISDKLKVEKLEGSKKVGKAKVSKLKFDKNLPTISLLQIGGTISSRVDYSTGAVTASFTPEDIINMYPALENIANFKSKLVSNIFSGDMRFSNYKPIIEAIKDEIKKGDIKGIILPHGTDTMAYTAAMLSFMIENSPIPIILVGSQRSSDRGSTDAFMNLICACEFITKTDFTGVGICMHYTSDDKECVILPACKSRKLHTSRRDAFKAINTNPIAIVDFKTRKINFIEKNYEKFDKTKKTEFKTGIEEKVALVKSHPNFSAEQLEVFKTKKYKGLVIEGTGLGHLPVQVTNPESKPNAENLKMIEELVKGGCTIVMTSQCIFGRVQMHVYGYGVKLSKAGVISGEDMLPETAFIKLAWLLGNYPKEKVKELMGTNLRGEINEGIKYEDDVLAK